MMKLYAPHENIFDTIVIDVTHRCNMQCVNCYLPNRNIPDIDIAKLEECLKQLPKRTSIRIGGAEATMRSDLPEIIYRIRKLGHRVILLTNGLRLSRNDYVQTLSDAGLRHVYISLNGADNDDWYERIDNLRCASKKCQAIENILAQGMLLTTGTILVRGVNDNAPNRVIQLIKSYQSRHALLGFKNVGALGRFDKEAEQKNFTMREMETKLASAIGCGEQDLFSYIYKKNQQDQNSRLFPMNLHSKTLKGIWIKLTDWQADKRGFVDRSSTRRGRLTPDFKIAPFFEHVKENEGAY